MGMKSVYSCTITECIYPATIVFIITITILGFLQIFVYRWIVGKAKDWATSNVGVGNGSVGIGNGSVGVGTPSATGTSTIVKK